MNTFPKDQGTLLYVIDIHSFPMSSFQDQSWEKYQSEIIAAVGEIEKLGIFKFKQATEPADWKKADITIRFEKLDGEVKDITTYDLYGHCVVTEKDGRRVAKIGLDIDQRWGHTWWQVVRPWRSCVHFRQVVMHELLHALGWREHTPETVRDYSIMDERNAGGYSKGLPMYDRWQIRKIYGLA